MLALAPKCRLAVRRGAAVVCPPCAPSVVVFCLLLHPFLWLGLFAVALDPDPSYNGDVMLVLVGACGSACISAPFCDPDRLHAAARERLEVRAVAGQVAGLAKPTCWRSGRGPAGPSSLRVAALRAAHQACGLPSVLLSQGQRQRQPRAMGCSQRPRQRQHHAWLRPSLPPTPMLHRPVTLEERRSMHLGRASPSVWQDESSRFKGAGTSNLEAINHASENCVSD